MLVPFLNASSVDSMWRRSVSTSGVGHQGAGLIWGCQRGGPLLDGVPKGSQKDTNQSGGGQRFFDPLAGSPGDQNLEMLNPPRTGSLSSHVEGWWFTGCWLRDSRESSATLLSMHF